MIDSDCQAVLGEGFRVEATLVAVPTQAPPTPPEAACRLFERLALLEDSGTSQEEGLSREYQRLELKLDLLIELLSRHLHEHLPPPSVLTLSAEGVAAPAHLLAKECARIALYPSARIPQSVVLELDRLQCSGEWCAARWATEDETLRDALSRWVFRLHRRALARARMKTQRLTGTQER